MAGSELTRKALSIFLSHSWSAVNTRLTTLRSNEGPSNGGFRAYVERFLDYIRWCVEDERRNRLDPRGLTVLALAEQKLAILLSGRPYSEQEACIESAMKCLVNSLAASRSGDAPMAALWETVAGRMQFLS